MIDIVPSFFSLFKSSSIIIWFFYFLKLIYLTFLIILFNLAYIRNKLIQQFFQFLKRSFKDFTILFISPTISVLAFDISDFTLISSFLAFTISEFTPANSVLILLKTFQKFSFFNSINWILYQLYKVLGLHLLQYLFEISHFLEIL